MMEYWDALFHRVPLVRYTLLITLIASVSFGVVGTFVVARRISYIAAAIAHAALGGIAAAMYLERTQGWAWCTPTAGALVAAVGSAIAIGLVTLRGREREDTVISVIWAFGMSAGLLILQFMPGEKVDLHSFLFGNINITNRADLVVNLVLSVSVLITVVRFYHPIVAVCFDEEFARLRGINVTFYYLLLLILTAICVVLLVQLAGIMLAIALLVLPAATASRVTHRLWHAMIVAVALTMFYTVLGQALSFQPRLAPGPVIVVLATVFWLIIFFFSQRGRARAKPESVSEPTSE